MSIIIQFGPSAVITSGTILPSSCIVEAETTLEMGPGLNHDPEVPIMSDDDNSIVDFATTSDLHNHSTKLNKAASDNPCGLGGCFGLPYQDHNYGAPPPPTPPTYSPHHSPVRVNGIADEDTSFSVISTSTNNEESHEGSVTRCICGYEHDDEYMICCDQCLVWQHVDCMGLNRNNIPETYLCEKCEPRKVDKQKAKILQARKRVAMTDTSDESEEDISNQNSEQNCKLRSKSSKRKRDELRFEGKNEQAVLKRSRTNSRNYKDSLEMNRSVARRRIKSKSDGTSTADEEAQDAWECGLECLDKYEHAVDNQYSPAVLLLASTLRNHEEDEQKVSELLRSQFCKVAEIPSGLKRLVAMCDLYQDQVIVEYRGKFLTSNQFHQQHPIFNKRVFPFVLFYKLYPDDDFCVDASKYGNDARFVRRSCKPNSEVRHVVLEGKIHLYLSTMKEINKDEEITIPFDHNYKDCIREIDCACGDEDCLIMGLKNNGGTDVNVEKKRKGKRSSVSVEDDSSQSFTGVGSPTKSNKISPIKINSCGAHSVAISVSSVLTENSESKIPSDEQEIDEQVTDKRKKMTREERKIDAIMRAFDQMEKAAKRRKQALDRIAQQKAQQQKPDEHSEKLETPTLTIKEEKPTVVLNTEAPPILEEEKIPTVPTGSQPPKPKKGKRRRGSGTPVRRRTRTNSGGSDIMSPDETTLCNTQCNTPTPGTLPENLPATSVGSPVMPQSSIPSPGLPITPVIHRMKKLLLHGWLRDNAESNTPIPATVSITQTPLPPVIQTEVNQSKKDISSTCYVRCTKDSPVTGGISAAHLRRSSTSSQMKQPSEQGSAKKRWLRQAMYECGGLCEVELSEGGNIDIINSPLQNGCLSPTSHGDLNSPCAANPEVDVVTPLKKRRLMRESVESISSPKSPTSAIVDCTMKSGESPEHSSLGTTFAETFPPINLEKHLNISTDDRSSKFRNRMKQEKYEHISSIEVSEQPTKPLRMMKSKLLKKHKKLELRTSFINSSHCETEAVLCATSSKNDLLRSSELSFEVLSLSKPQNAEAVNSSHEINLGVKLSPKRTCVEKSYGESSSLNVSPNSTFILPGSHSLKESYPSEEDPVNQNNDAQSPECTDISNHIVKKVHDFVIEEVLQEPSSTTVDCVSSSYSSSVNNTNAVNLVTCNGSSVQTPVSSSCYLTDEYSLQDISPGSVTNHPSPAEASDLQSKSNVPQISQISTTSNVNPPVATSTFNTVRSNVWETLNNQSSGSNVSSSSAVVPVPSDEQAVSHEIITSSCGSITSSSAHQSLSNSFNCQTNVSSTIVGISQSSSSTVHTVSSVSSVCRGDTSTSMSSSSSTARKRKVSLSEYRMRMRDHAGNANNNRSRKCNNVNNLSITTEALPEQPIKLASLPLFEAVPSSQLTDGSFIKQQDSKAPKKKEADSSGEQKIYCPNGAEVLGRREDLTQRLKREFGLDDDSNSDGKIDGSQLNSKVSCTLQVAQNIVPILSLCTQPPPPPPPLTRSTTSPPFSYSVAQPYTQQPYIVAQVTTNPFVAQSSLTQSGVLPVLHHISAPLPAQPLLQQSHTYPAPLQTTMPRQSQAAFPSVNSQGYTSLTQPPPPPPPPPPHQGYIRPYKSGHFK